MTQSSGKRRLGATQIRMGLPIKWALFGPNGNLLLREGAIVEAEHQVESLMRAGAYYYTGPNLTEYNPLAPDVAPVSVYELVCSLIQRLASAYECVALGESLDATPAKFAAQIEALVLDIQAFSHECPGAVLGSTQLIMHAPSHLVHALHCAMVCEIAASKLAWPPQERVPLVAAALTQNIALVELQKTLDSQEGPLTEEQRLQVREHPRSGVKLLHQLGVDDRLWLSTVFQHHERLDGSGYPRGLQGKEIIREARLLAIVDSYVAMTRPRAYRQTLRSRDAIKELFKQRGQAIDSRLSDLFLMAVGLFAPGSLIRRLRGEVAVVYAISPHPEKLVVSTITDTRSHSLEKPAPPVVIDITEVSGVLNLTDYEKLVAHMGQIWPDPLSLQELI